MLLAAMAVQIAPAGVFAPPLGVPILVETERAIGEGDARQVYRVDRLVRFQRDGAGYLAEVVMLRTGAEATRNEAAMLEAGFSALVGRTIRFRLDAAGTVLGIDDMDAVWEAFCAGVVALVQARRDGTSAAELAALADRIAAPLRAIPPARRQAMIASLIDPLVAEEAGEAPGAERPVRVPGGSPFGGQVSLEGTRRVTSAGLLVRSATRASGRAVPPVEGPAAAIELEIAREADPRTGLLATSVETLTTIVGEGDAARRTRRVTTVRVAPRPDHAWPE